jgi:lysophospholipase L1-like esterase
LLGSATSTFTTPSGCYFVVLRARTSSVADWNTQAEDSAQLELGSVGTTYESYKKIIPLSDIEDGDKIAVANAPGKNLIDKTTIMQGYAIDGSYGIVASPDNSIFRIPVLGSTKYTYQVNTRYPSVISARYEDEDNVLISGAVFGASPFTFTTPSTCRFVVLRARTSSVADWNTQAEDSAQLELGIARTAYEPYSLHAPVEKISGLPFLTKDVYLPWKGLQILFFGDSITANDFFQPVLQNIHGFGYVNNALGGSRITKLAVSPDGTSLVERLGAVNAVGADCIFVFAGSNDMVAGVSLGAITDTVDTTFYGAVKALIVSLQANNSGKRVVFCTPLQRGNSRAVYAAQKVYPDAMKEVCALYGVPVLDLFYTSGITYENIGQYTSDNTHPTLAGAKFIARQMSGFLFRN